MKRITLILCAMAIMAIAMFTSCVSQRKILYLQNETMLNDSVFMSIEYENERNFNYKVQPGDNLYIRIASLDEMFSKYFNSVNQSSSMGYTSTTYSSGNAAIYLNGYTVGADGNIELPFVGEVFVKDFTVDEIQSKIQEIMSEYLKETVVYVKLGLFNLTILGEVARPGQYQIYQSDINIFQAIALAGNATDFANKSEIKIIHQTTKGSQIVRVNLNDANILSSPDYYLKPNDIIYVEPLKTKQFGFTSVPYGTIISAISLLVTCFTFVIVYLK
ncbi:MAG: polysaccharide biosynthesis/export family protein [Bacteroidales bacterium]|nr:polysaccharide biosynthesis/export family protein [Bacteroidales bacterium]